MKTPPLLLPAIVFVSGSLLLSACKAPSTPAGELPAPKDNATLPAPAAPTETIQSDPVQLDPCSLLSEEEVSLVLGGPVQAQAAMGTGGCSYSLISDDPSLMTQLALSAAQGEEAKILTVLGIGFLAGFSGDPNMAAEFELLNNELPSLSLRELVDRLGGLFQGTGVGATRIEEADGTGLWLLYQTESYSQGTLLLVRGDEYVSLTLIGGDAITPDRLASLGDTVFERLPPAFYNLDAEGDGSFSIELGSEGEPEAAMTPAGTAEPEEVKGLVWVTAPNAGQVYAIDPNTDDLIATIDVGRFPRDIAVAAGSVWVLSDTEGTVWRIDPETFEVVQTILFNMNTINIDVGPETLWVAGGGGLRMLDISTGTRYDVVYNQCYDVAIGEGAIWVSQSQDQQLLKIDPATRRVVATIKLEGQPSWIAYGHGMVWTVLSDTKQLVAIDPATGQVAHAEPFRYVTHALVPGPEGIWFTDPLALFSITPGTWETGAVSTSKPSVGIAFYAGSVWATSGEEGYVTRYNPLSGKAQAVIQFSTDPVGIAAGE